MSIVSTALYVILFLQYAAPVVLFTMLGLVSAEKVAVGYQLGRGHVVQLSPEVGSSKFTATTGQKRSNFGPPQTGERSCDGLWVLCMVNLCS